MARQTVSVTTVKNTWKIDEKRKKIFNIKQTTVGKWSKVQRLTGNWSDSSYCFVIFHSDFFKKHRNFRPDVRRVWWILIRFSQTPKEFIFWKASKRCFDCKTISLVFLNIYATIVLFFVWTFKIVRILEIYIQCYRRSQDKLYTVFNHWNGRSFERILVARKNIFNHLVPKDV